MSHFLLFNQSEVIDFQFIVIDYQLEMTDCKTISVMIQIINNSNWFIRRNKICWFIESISWKYWEHKFFVTLTDILLLFTAFSWAQQICQ